MVVLIIIIVVLMFLWAFTHALGEDGDKLEVGIAAITCVLVFVLTILMYLTSEV